MLKIIARIAPAVAIVLLLLGGTAQAAELPVRSDGGSASSAITGSADNAPAPENATRGGRSATSGSAGTAGSTDAAPGPRAGETKAIVVGTLGFVLMVGTAGAVLWYTARNRHLPE
ncbi:MAG TPA: hypothetical protein VHC18_00045 [Amycolatopsis sp.]|nr:hypothetical protein [Amycolatopsis sp.]